MVLVRGGVGGIGKRSVEESVVLVGELFPHIFNPLVRSRPHD